MIQNPRLLIAAKGLLLGSSLSLGLGCSSPTPKVQPSKVSEPAQSSFASASGSAEIYGPLPGHQPRWSVRWKHSEVTAAGLDNSKPLDVTGTGLNISSGRMVDVTGRTYRDGKPELTFSADSGAGDKQNRTLDLQGHVKVTSLKRQETMTADEVVYDASNHLLTARGNVRFGGRVGSVGTFSELLATSDFKRIGTPEQFNQR